MRRPNRTPAPHEAARRDAHVLRVVTYNVHSCVGTDRQIRPDRISEVLRTLEPDVVALQELEIGRLRTGHVDQVKVLADALEMEAVFQRAIRWPDGDYGIAVLTRLSVHAVEGRKLPGPRLPYIQPRVAQLLRLHTADGDLAFVNTHLGLLRRERVGQIEELCAWLGGVIATTPTVLCGDLNAPPHARECQVLERLLSDAFGDGLHGSTFPVHFPVSRLDQIRVSQHLECVRVAIPRNALTRVASDHFPVVADVRVRPVWHNHLWSGGPTAPFL